MFWLAILFLLRLCAALPNSNPQHGYTTTATIRQIHEFPNVTWVENIAVRSNGQLLVTVVTTPDVYQIDPFESNPVPKLIAHFPDSLAVLGITEIEQDVFAVVRGNFSVITGEDIPGSFYVSRIDLRSHPAKISTIAHVADSIVLNGITAVEEGSNFLLVADSFAGVVWRVNIETSQVDSVLNTTATRPALPAAKGGLGINGVHTGNGYLYLTNTNLGFYRVPIHSDGTTAGKVEKIASFIAGDDFALAACGTAYVARGATDAINKVTPSGAVTALDYTNAKAPVLIEGNTAARFGRTKCDKNTLYVTTNGGLSGLVNGTVTHGGRVLALDFAGIS